MNRRDFLKQTGVLLTLNTLSHLFPSISFASSSRSAFTLTKNIGAGRPEDHFAVLIRTFGGLDATLGLDPQELPPGADERDLFLEYRKEDILKVEGHKFGPSAKALVPLAKQIAIVNGVMMRRDAGHETLNQYMATGRGDGKAAAFPVELALAYGSGPFGVLMSHATYLAGKTAILSGINDIKNDSDQSKLVEMLEEKLSAIGSEGGTLEEAQKMVVAGKDSAIRLTKNLADYKKQFGELSNALVVAAAFTAGASGQAQLDIYLAANLDTHSDHPKNHLDAQTKIWNSVAEILTTFQKIPYLGKTLFDFTTFMAYTEFSRTPFLNSARGKDHNPMTNSVLLAGKNVAGGKTFGESRVLSRKQTENGVPLHIGRPYDFKKQKLAESPVGASFFYPENVIQSIGKMFGSPPGFDPIDAKFLPIPGLARS